ncbi:MAG: type II toxin-antitoxin system RelE/ParE family toxin [Acidobacteria bacterium]|nr:type II toxin-antitoxin system RelE/ParE family toxin [Acidobacteriota bacterium]
MKVIWTRAAFRDRLKIWEHIAEDNPSAAAQLDEAFSRAANRLVQHPKLGKLGKIPGTREVLPHEHYRLVYEILGPEVWILAVVHTARQWPPLDGK